MGSLVWLLTSLCTVQAYQPAWLRLAGVRRSSAPEPPSPAGDTEGPPRGSRCCQEKLSGSVPSRTAHVRATAAPSGATAAVGRTKGLETGTGGTRLSAAPEAAGPFPPSCWDPPQIPPVPRGGDLASPDDLLAGEVLQRLTRMASENINRLVQGVSWLWAWGLAGAARYGLMRPVMG